MAVAARPLPDDVRKAARALVKALAALTPEDGRGALYLARGGRLALAATAGLDARTARALRALPDPAEPPAPFAAHPLPGARGIALVPATVCAREVAFVLDALGGTVGARTPAAAASVALQEALAAARTPEDMLEAALRYHARRLGAAGGVGVATRGGVEVARVTRGAPLPQEGAPLVVPLTGPDAEPLGHLAFPARPRAPPAPAAEARLVGLALARALTAAPTLAPDLLDHVPAGVIALDERGVITYENRFLLRILGAKGGARPGAAGHNIFSFPDLDALPDLRDRLRALLQNGTSFEDLAFTYRSPFGREVALLASGYPRNDGPGPGVLFLRDVTEQQALQRRLHGYAASLEQQVAERTGALVAANEALTRAKLNLETVFNATPDGFLFVDKDMTLAAANSRMCDLFGLSVEEALAADKEKVREVARACYADPREFDRGLALYTPERRHEVHDATVELRAPEGGAPRIVHEHSEPIVDGNGAYVGRVWTYRDITGERRLSRALEERTRFLDGIVQNVVELIFTLDPHGWVTYVNGRTCEVAGHGAPELLGRPFLQFISPTEREATEAALARALKGERVVDVPTSLRRRDGATVPLLLNLVPIQEGGKMVEVVGTAQDVSRRQALERALRVRTELLGTVMDNTEDGVFALDPGGAYLFLNRKYRELLDLGPDEGVGDGFLAPLASDAAAQEALRGIDRGKDVVGLEVPVVTRAGTRRHLLWNVRHIRDAGVTRQIVGTVTDLTARKRLEEELVAYAKGLEGEVERRTASLLQAEKMVALGQLVAGVAHEVNNPLAFIISNSQVLREVDQEILGNSHVEALLKGDVSQAEAALRYLRESGNLDFLMDKRAHLVDANLNGLKRIANIVTTLRNFAAPPARRSSPVDLGAMLKDTAILFRAQFRDRVVLEEDYGDLPPVRCDGGQINQVVMNLLVNAVEAIQQSDRAGCIRLEARAVPGGVVIHVRDDGPGIPAAHLARIFDPFFTTKPRGTGLGLSISYTILKEHGGTIAVESVPEKGTTFTLTLPLGAPPS